MKSICVFCGSTFGVTSAFRDAAVELGELIAKKNIRIIYGGGKVGLMGVLADAALAAGGQVIGIIPDFLHAREVFHTGLTELIVVKSMHERKMEMAKRADLFIALPGGFGTFEELFEAITWTQLKLQKKPVGLLNVGGFYDDLLTFLNRAVKEEFITTDGRSILISHNQTDQLLERLVGQLCE